MGSETGSDRLLSAPAPVMIVIGVAGSGKSTVGRALASGLGVPFVDGDDLHTVQNIAKMAAGQALDDEDRLPWLAALAAQVGAMASARGGVIACSALKRKYREPLLAAASTVSFLQLTLSPEVARARVSGRRHHFMPAELIESQYDHLEPLDPSEPGLAVDATCELEDEVAAARRYLAEHDG